MSRGSDLQKAVLSQACPLCGAQPGQKCSGPIGKFSRWHYARFIQRPIPAVRHAVLSGSPNHGKSPCGHCRRHRHFLCTGYYAHNHGVRGVLCTCECAAAKRKQRESA